MAHDWRREPGPVDFWDSYCTLVTCALAYANLSSAMMKHLSKNKDNAQCLLKSLEASITYDNVSENNTLLLVVRL